MRQGILPVVIASGQTVSPDVDLRGGSLRAITVPVVVSGDLFIRGSFDTTSANFRRIQNIVYGNPGTGDMRLAVGPGSNMVLLPVDVEFPPYIRLEMGAPASGGPQSFSVRFKM